MTGSWIQRMPPPSSWTYRDYLIAALLDWPGYRAHRSRVIEKVGQLRKGFNASLPEKFEQTVQQALERHCAESKNFCGDPGLALFCFPEGKGTGIWELNVSIIDEYLLRNCGR